MGPLTNNDLYLGSWELLTTPVKQDTCYKHILYL